MSSGHDHSHPHIHLPPAVLAGLAAAVLFGASTPFAKLLLNGIGPWMLAGLLYLGSGLGLTLVAFLRPKTEAISRADAPWLAAAVVFGGVLAPVLLMWGLTGAEGSTASLLLTTEGVFTSLLAWATFKENIGQRIAYGMGAITLGALALAWDGTPSLTNLGPPAAILGACLCWGIDNNLTRKVSLSDPVRIASLKGLAAGSCNLVLALMVAQDHLPGLEPTLMAAAVGFLGYGVSLVLYVLALRGLGSARAGAYFSMAPLIGALLALPLLGESPSPRLAAAAIAMGLGLWLHLTERHEHRHDHPVMDHSHPHDHSDPHHSHVHDHGEETPTGPHSHPHHHSGLEHVHAHFPDAHHRHEHPGLKSQDERSEG
jgi:drug/metabolite transporter (DMT)-like permease